MWFDPHAYLRGDGGTPAIPASPASRSGGIAGLAGIAASHSALENATDLFEERAAIREFDGGQHRPDAEAIALVEAARLTGVPIADLQANLRAGKDAP